MFQLRAHLRRVAVVAVFFCLTAPTARTLFAAPGSEHRCGCGSACWCDLLQRGRAADHCKLPAGRGLTTLRSCAAGPSLADGIDANPWRLVFPTLLVLAALVLFGTCAGPRIPRHVTPLHELLLPPPRRLSAV
jgi:hypothetical protein